VSRPSEVSYPPPTQGWGPPSAPVPPPPGAPGPWPPPPPGLPPPAWPPAPEPRPAAGSVAGVALWRLGIGGLALYYARTGREETMSSESLSYLSNLGVGLAFLALAAYPVLVGGRATEPRSAWLRGAATVTMLLVGVTFVGLMGEEADGPHAVIPALVLVDWLFVGRSQFRTRWWEPPTWTAFLLLYLGYHQSNDVPLYDDILGDDVIATMVPAFLAGTVVVGYLLWAAVLVRRAVAGGGGGGRGGGDGGARPHR
jgi:hypothetical protein